jgi:hypothetical protein
VKPRAAWPPLLAVLLAAATATAAPAAPAPRDSLRLADRLVPFGHAPHAGPRAIDTVVIHSSWDALGPDPYDLDGLLAEYRGYDVAPHFVVDRAGTVWRTVAENDVAWHAGRSRMPDGRTGVNAFSLGIEVMTTKDDHPTDAQYAALRALLALLRERYPIRHVVGHAAIAPDRKTDPWNFDFTRLE